jgi:hypothetical protein
LTIAIGCVHNRDSCTQVDELVSAGKSSNTDARDNGVDI